MENRTTLLWASFLTLIAAGVGFAIRGAILGDWAAQYGFTKGELGTITGGGLVGFGFTIIICSLIVDRVGYKPLLILAFVLHAASAAITLAATPIYDSMGKDAAYQCLYWGMFMFALANGVCEAVINPLVATLYPKEKTHYLNILHAGWPGGLILGGLFAFAFCGETPAVTHLRWEIPMAIFLVPMLAYGLLVLKEPFPTSEAESAGVSFAEQLATFASPILLFLLVLHAMIGYVELGVDSWMPNIIGNILASNSFLLFTYASAFMFVLRFFAGPIVERINPVGLLAVSGVLGFVGLIWLGTTVQSTLSVGTGATATLGELSGTMVFMVVAATTVYALGKTFLWPTILGVVGERFPRGGALVMGAMGGVGMLSAGLLGGPGIGFKQDYYSADQLKAASAETYNRYKADSQSSFLIWKTDALDGSKVATIMDDGKQLAADKKILADKGRKLSELPELEKLSNWWDGAKAFAKVDRPLVQASSIYGGAMGLKWTSVVPAGLAVGFALLFVYFMSTGGYQAIELKGHKPEGEEFTGGTKGPMQA